MRRGVLYTPKVPQECPEDVARLIASCTTLTPERRPTVKASFVVRVYG